MTSTRSDDGFEFDCDLCGENWRPPRLGRGSEPRNWHECWELAKKEGWRAVKVRSQSGKEDWEHRCKKC